MRLKEVLKVKRISGRKSVNPLQIMILFCFVIFCSTCVLARSFLWIILTGSIDNEPLVLSYGSLQRNGAQNRQEI